MTRPLRPQCAIYLLIAGTYTPFIVALFSGPNPLLGPDGRNWARIVLPLQWGLCALGIGVET